MEPDNFLKKFFQGSLRRSLRMVPVLLLMVFLTLACTLSLGGPQPPAERVSPTGQADWQSILANAKPGDQVTIPVTEQQLTSIMANGLRNQQQVTVENPRVVLRDGKMEVYGRAVTESVSANFRVDLNVQVDGQGNPKLTVVSADFGGIPVPESLQVRLTETLNQAMLDAIRPASNRFRANSVTITDGLMQINGTVQ